jgi:GxxExxY protein
MPEGEGSGYVRAEYPESEVTSCIIAAAQRVHRELGPGFEEIIYQRALALELPAHGLEFDREVWIDVYYRGRRVGRKRVDFLIEDVLVEIKAKSAIEDVDVIQTLSYLRSSGGQIGLLINFGNRSLGIKRLIHTPPEQ